MRVASPPQRSNKMSFSKTDGTKEKRQTNVLIPALFSSFPASNYVLLNFSDFVLSYVK